VGHQLETVHARVRSGNERGIYLHLTMTTYCSQRNEISIFISWMKIQAPSGYLDDHIDNWNSVLTVTVLALRNELE